MSYRRLHSQYSAETQENQKAEKEKQKIPDLIERYKAAFALSGASKQIYELIR